MLAKFGFGRPRFGTPADAGNRGTFTLRDRTRCNPRVCKYPIASDVFLDNSRSICRLACCAYEFSMPGSIVVMLGRKPCGNDAATPGKTGAPGWPNENDATLYFVPSRCSAFEVARSGMRS